MPTFDQIFPLVPLAILAFFAWRYFRSGSLVGALLGGRITDALGEIPLSSSSFSSRVLKVSVLAPSNGGPPEVALAVTSKAPLAASVVPIKLSMSQARELIELLQRATSR
ncbi:MAG TPA: hypothetical protein VGI65_03805 [Steroidobacteraceae bacterium]|jgi:hypothetical protein